jgi:putative transposase
MIPAMSRPWRIQFPNAVYHVTSRGNNRQVIFRDDPDREKLLGLLDQASSRFNIHILAFCLMSNHYHLFLRTPGANLSAAMHWLNTSYSGYFQRRWGQSGHIFQGRYKAVVVVDEAHWQRLSMYIHLNPVRAGIVNDPASYEWSSFRDYTSSRSRFSWIKPEYILAQYGKSETLSRRIYRSSCTEILKRPPSFWHDIRSAVVLGSREALEKMAKTHRPKGKYTDVTDFMNSSRVKVDLDTEISKIAKAFDARPEDIMMRHRNFPPRQAAYYHLVENCSMPVTRVAEIMGIRQTAVSNGISRLKGKILKDKKLRKNMEQLSVM